MGTARSPSPFRWWVAVVVRRHGSSIARNTSQVKPDKLHSSSVRIEPTMHSLD